MDFFVTTIIPVYNVEEYLGNAIDSLINQSDFEHVEVVLIDDGSTDSSGHICDEYADSYQNITVYHIDNQGVSNARNFGFRKANGTYVHFMDSDDVLVPGFYKEFNNKAVEYNPDMMVCGCIRENTVTSKVTLACNKQDLYLDSKAQIGKYLYTIKSENKRWMLDYIWNKWYRREVFQKSLLTFDERLSLGEDFLFNCKALENVEHIYISKTPFYIYYIRSGGLVTKFQKSPWISRQILSDAHIGLYQTYDIYENNKEKLMLEDGILAFAALREVNNSRCNLTKSEKNLFIAQMMDSHQMKLAMYYLSHSAKGLDKLWYLLIKILGRIGVNIIILADKIHRNIKKR